MLEKYHKTAEHDPQISTPPERHIFMHKKNEKLEYFCIQKTKKIKFKLCSR